MGLLVGSGRTLLVSPRGGHVVRRTHEPSAYSAASLSATLTKLVVVMAKEIQQLTAMAVTRVNKQGLYH